VDPDAQEAAPTTILVVEDSLAISDVAATALRFQGYDVVQVADGLDGLTHATTHPVDLIVLDVMLPGMDGFEVCRRLREQDVPTPVLFLTARGDLDDRVRGLDVGGDDYLPKPFTVDELTLRVAAILRRANPAPITETLQVGSLSLDPATLEASRDGRSIELSATEYRLLHYLMVNEGVVLSKSRILEAVWGDDGDHNPNVVELYIGYLRRKLDGGRPPLIETRRGLGYLLREDSA